MISYMILVMILQKSLGGDDDEKPAQKRNLKEFPESSKYSPDDLPKYSYYNKATVKRGSSIDRYKDKETGKTTTFQSSTSKLISLDIKIEEIIKKVQAGGLDNL